MNSLALLEFVGAFKGGDHEWQKQRLDELAELKRIKQTNNARLQHELRLLETQFAGQLEMEKHKQQQIVRDYKNFLDSIEETKQKLIDSYPDMPRPMVLLIHHHAKELLDQMWVSKNKDQRAYALSEERFTHFFLTMLRDATERMQADQPGLPHQTLKLLTGQVSSGRT